MPANSKKLAIIKKRCADVLANSDGYDTVWWRSARFCAADSRRPSGRSRQPASAGRSAVGEDLPSRTRGKTRGAMLIINDLSLRIAGRLLLDHASLTLPAGTKAGLVGRNGTGKTTLFRAITGEIAAETGLDLPAEEHAHRPGRAGGAAAPRSR